MLKYAVRHGTRKQRPSGKARVPLPPTVAASGALTGPLRHAPINVTSARVETLFLHYHATGKLGLRVLIHNVGHNHSVDNAPRLVPAHGAFPCRSCPLCLSVLSHASNLAAEPDIPRDTKSSKLPFWHHLSSAGVPTAAAAEPLRTTPALGPRPPAHLHGSHTRLQPKVSQQHLSGPVTFLATRTPAARLRMLILAPVSSSYGIEQSSRTTHRSVWREWQRQNCHALLVLRGDTGAAIPSEEPVSCPA